MSPVCPGGVGATHLLTKMVPEIRLDLDLEQGAGKLPTDHTDFQRPTPLYQPVRSHKQSPKAAPMAASWAGRPANFWFTSSSIAT